VLENTRFGLTHRLTELFFYLLNIKKMRNQYYFLSWITVQKCTYKMKQMGVFTLNIKYRYTLILPHCGS